MRRLRTVDRALLALLGIWILAFALHLREVQRSGLAQPAVFVAMPESPSAYPLVRGFRIEQTASSGGLEIGDRLLRVGDVDLRGVGHIGVDAFAIAQAGDDAHVDVVYERDGRAARARIELARSPVPWTRAPTLVGMVLLSLVVLLRAAPTPQRRLLYLAFMTTAIAQTPFHGGSIEQTYASKVLFYALGPIAPALVLRWAMRFPEEAPPPPRGFLLVPWLLAAVYAFLRANYLVNGPLPAEWVPRLISAVDGMLLLGIVAALTRNYLRTNRVGRRRVKWFLYGVYVGFGPLALTLLVPVFWGEPTWYPLAFGLAGVFTAILPVCVFFAIVRQQLFDIDHLISATASYTALGVVVLAGALSVVPRLADALSAAMGVGTEAGRVMFTLLLAAAVVPAHRRIRPQVDAIFFPERHTLETGVHDLLSELSAYGVSQELVRRVAERLDALLRPESAIVYSWLSEKYAAVYERGRGAAPDLALDDPIVVVMKRQRAPLCADLRGARGERGSALEWAILEEFRASAIAPVNVDERLEAFLCFGGKRSGDIYTRTDIALLGAVVDRMATQLERMKDAATIREERALKGEFRRYVPGSIADHIERGDLLEAGEREVSVLFVDIRGYTAYAEQHDAAQVFSVINRHTARVSEIVEQNGGTIVEFSGDGLMAVFGAPDDLAAKERSAVIAAEEILVVVGSHSADEPVRVGIGIATGPAFVGSIRSADRLIWSALGATTNLAARLQQQTRELDAAIVVDVATHGGAGAFAGRFTRVEQVALRGFSESRDVFVRRA